MKWTRRALLAFGLILALGVSGSTFESSHTGTVVVVHGVPDLTVDVYVNGELTLESFAPGSVTDPLESEPGTYDIEIRVAGESADSDRAISGSAEVAAGTNASIVAHLTADGTPSLVVFANDVSRIPAGESRITVRHAAAAPEVDVCVDGEVTVENVANGQEASLQVPAGTYSVAVSATGDETPVIGPTDLELAEGTHYLVYAIGSLDEGTLDLVVQTISGLHTTPDGVPAGTGSTATGSSLTMLAAAVSLGALLIGASTFALRYRRA